MGEVRIDMLFKSNKRHRASLDGKILHESMINKKLSEIENRDAREKVIREKNGRSERFGSNTKKLYDVNCAGDGGNKRKDVLEINTKNDRHLTNNKNEISQDSCLG